VLYKPRRDVCGVPVLLIELQRRDGALNLIGHRILPLAALRAERAESRFYR
jgi:hypothetical protein